MEIIHHVNIIIHVLAGTVALIVGVIAIITNKDYKRHIRFGRYFMRAVAIVILTGLIGVFIFKRNTFLLVITLLSGYNCFSGIRTIRLRGQKPKLYDVIIPVIVISSALYYLYYIQSIGLFWAPSVIYSTLGALFIVTSYDLAKPFMTVRTRKKAFIYEHVYKMISAFIALASAFLGTVFPQYKPYSQLLPSLLGIAYTFFIFIRLNQRPTSLKRSIS